MSAPIRIAKTEFPIILDKDGVEHVKLVDLCEPFGLDIESQGRRLKKTAWATPVMVTGVRSSGKRSKFLCLPLRRVPMFFATLDAGRVNAGFRPLLGQMQNESADAIYKYCAHGGAIHAEALPSQLVALKSKIDEILRAEPATDFVWPPAFCKRYEAWHGRRWSAGDRPPFSMKSANFFVWEMIFPPEILAIIRTRAVIASALRELEADAFDLEDLRIMAEKSQRELAEKLGVSQAAVSKWRAADAKVATLRARLDALGFDLVLVARKRSDGEVCVLAVGARGEER